MNGGGGGVGWSGGTGSDISEECAQVKEVGGGGVYAGGRADGARRVE